MGFNAQNWITVFLFLFAMGVCGILYDHWWHKHDNDDKKE